MALRIAALTSIFIAACGTQSVLVATPAVARIEVHGAVVAPLKRDGAPWDGPPGADQDLLKHQLRTLLDSPPPSTTLESWTGFATKVVGICASATALHLQRPDLVGVASLDRGRGFEEEIRLTSAGGGPVRDEFDAMWTPPATFPHVELTDAVLLRVTILDSDVVHDDPVETVQITARELRVAAEQRGAVVTIPVASQGSRQALMVKVAVIPES